MSANRHEPVEPEAQPSPFGRIRLAAGIAALVLLAVFLLQNLQQVEIHFLWFDWSTRMLWALIASALIGAVAAVALATLRRRDVR